MIITASRIRRLLSSIVEWLAVLCCSCPRIKQRFLAFQSRLSHSAMSLFFLKSPSCACHSTLDVKSHPHAPPCSSSPYFIPSNPALRATPSSSSQEKKAKNESMFLQLKKAKLNKQRHPPAENSNYTRPRIFFLTTRRGARSHVRFPTSLHSAAGRVRLTISCLLTPYSVLKSQEGLRKVDKVDTPVFSFLLGIAVLARKPLSVKINYFLLLRYLRDEALMGNRRTAMFILTNTTLMTCSETPSPK